MNDLCPRWKLALMVLVVGSLTAFGSAWAQTDDGWSLLVTPQLWFTHIEKNGFAPPAGNPGQQIVISDPVTDSGTVLSDTPFTGTNSKPIDWAYPQWGAQIAAQKGRLTLAGAFQRV